MEGPIQNLTGNSLGSTFTFTVMDPGSTCTHSYRMNQGPIFTLTRIIPPPFLAFKGLDPGPHSLLQGWTQVPFKHCKGLVQAHIPIKRKIYVRIFFSFQWVGPGSMSEGLSKIVGAFYTNRRCRLSFFLLV